MPPAKADAVMAMDAVTVANANLIVLAGRMAAKLLDGHPEEEIEAAFLAARLDHMALPYSKTWLRLLFS